MLNWVFLHFWKDSSKIHCQNWDLDLSDEGFWDSPLGRVCNRERAVLRQTCSQDYFSEKGRSETDPLGRVISDSCFRSLVPRSRSQKMLSKIFVPFFRFSIEVWQAPDAPSKCTTKKCTIKTYSFDLFSEVLESHSSSDLVWVVGAAAACLGGSARDLWKEAKRVRFDGAFFSGTFWWCIRGLPRSQLRLFLGVAGVCGFYSIRKP